MVPRPHLVLQGRQQCPHHRHHDHAYLWHGCLHTGPLRPCRRRHLYQSRRRGGRPRGQGGGRHPRRRPAQPRNHCRQRRRQRGRRGRNGGRPLRKLLRFHPQHGGSGGHSLCLGGRRHADARRRRPDAHRCSRGVSQPAGHLAGAHPRGGHDEKPAPLARNGHQHGRRTHCRRHVPHPLAAAHRQLGGRGLLRRQRAGRRSGHRPSHRILHLAVIPPHAGHLPFLTDRGRHGHHQGHRHGHDLHLCARAYHLGRHLVELPLRQRLRHVDERSQHPDRALRHRHRRRGHAFNAGHHAGHRRIRPHCRQCRGQCRDERAG